MSSIEQLLHQAYRIILTISLETFVLADLPGRQLINDLSKTYPCKLCIWFNLSLDTVLHRRHDMIFSNDLHFKNYLHILA